MTKPHTLIIGGTRGLGARVAKYFFENNHEVTVWGKEAPTPEIAQWISALTILDVTDHHALSQALSTLCQKQPLPQNVVFCQRYRGDGDVWEGELQTSLTATKTIIETLAACVRNSASFVIIGSVLNRFIAEDSPVAYHVAKAGLIQLTRYYALTLAPKGIRVNCVSPGTLLKPESASFYLETPKVNEHFRFINPQAKMATADEISKVVLFLCSPEASIITGQELVVDGGLSLQWQETLSKKMNPEVF